MKEQQYEVFDTERLWREHGKVYQSRISHYEFDKIAERVKTAWQATQQSDREFVGELVRVLKSAAFEIAQDEPNENYPDLVSEWQQTEQYLLLCKIDLVLQRANQRLTEGKPNE